MESTFASRVRQYRQGRGLSQQALAERCGLTQGNVAHMENGTEPKQSNVSKLLAGLPDLNPDWLLIGTGPMLRDGRALAFVPAGPPDEPTPPPMPAAPAAALYSGELLDKLLSQINSQAQQHREELALLKKEHKADLLKAARTAQYNMDAMHAKVHFMEGRLGLRPFTAEETAQAAQLAAATPPAKKIGLKHYDESTPTGRFGRHLSLSGVRIGEMSTALAA